MTMPSPAPALEGLPPGMSFKPDDDELVKLYLLPRARGQAAKIAGVVIEDDATSAAVPPWEVVSRHGRTKENGAYFFEHADDPKDGGGGARPDRRCGGRWTWVSQRRTPDKALRLPGGEVVLWNRRALNLHRGRGRSGSTGWVMHEYTIASPPCADPVKLCHVAFTGHGQKRQREPDPDPDGGVRNRKRATAASSSSSEVSTITLADLPVPGQQDQQEPFPTCLGPSQEPSFAFASLLPEQQQLRVPLASNPQMSQDHLDFDAYCALLASDDGSQLQQQMRHLLGGLPANAEAAPYHAPHIQMPPEQQEPGTMPPMTDHGSPAPWDDLDAFCSVPQPEDNNDMAAGTPADDGATSFSFWDRDGAFDGQGPV